MKAAIQRMTAPGLTDLPPGFSGKPLMVQVHDLLTLKATDAGRYKDLADTALRCAAEK